MFQYNDDDGDGGEKENYDHCGKLLGATQANDTLELLIMAQSFKWYKRVQRGTEWATHISREGWEGKNLPTVKLSLKILKHNIKLDQVHLACRTQ